MFADIGSIVRKPLTTTFYISVQPIQNELMQEVMTGIGSIGKLMDKTQSYNDAKGHHIMRRYWIYL